ncbi:uncharacterized protein A1O9_01192 [Exophiala aquamarina CBS 119918]|uniref:Thymocyte nuclear protein 1 n=1 Tax=Exophiala aquamarina CBS 119918 TaxID=1182545 RepID=A0A072Q5L2_9EURO|nr:uncharacterized protein A1O9_01192 [Exophiala aquamarina CBS 119918]KEF63215.1 hypothetical protein A1O9_01192 [Exophiala aquamarina CBS 119918]
MPPTKKRKVGAASSSSTPAKKVRISGASEIADVSPSGRPKRTSASKPQYNFTRKRAPPSVDQNSGTLSSTGSLAEKRGRPAKTGSPTKATNSTSTSKVPVTKTTSKQTPTSTAPARPVGRPASIKPKTASVVIKAPSAKRGRPASTKPKPVPVVTRAPPAERGRTPKSPNTGATPKASKEGPDSVPEAVQEEIKLVEDNGIVHQDVQYWLMKAEPESRITKGHDVKFSIDDLASKTEPEGWDGVRNPVARNNMCAMRKGDLAFFYHSNCAVPGIAGVMRIVEEHTVDESAFDPDHPYYDAKSHREKPKWELVKVEFVKKFDDLITLRHLKSLSLPGSALENMVMLKQSRLSVSPVTSSEWQFILDLAGEKISLGQATPQDGYETDIDSEGHDDMNANGDEANGTRDGDSLKITPTQTVLAKTSMNTQQPMVQ